MVPRRDGENENKQVKTRRGKRNEWQGGHVGPGVGRTGVSEQEAMISVVLISAPPRVCILDHDGPSKTT
jgi:hypothetical protein